MGRTGAGGPRGTLAGRLLLVLLSTVAALLAGELLARLAAPRPPRSPAELARALERSRRSPARRKDWKGLTGIVQPGPTPAVAYELRPNLAGTFLGQPFATNSWGLRSRELERAKPAGGFRIVGLGDSHLFGWGVGQDEVYLARLERRLDEGPPSGRRFEVVNCAVPGYNTVLEVARFEAKCAAFAPDLVVLHLVGNDLDLPHFLRLDRAPPPSYLLEAIRGLARGGREGDEDQAPRLVSRDGPSPQASPRAEAIRRSQELAGAEAARRALGRLAGWLAASGTPAVVMTMGQEGPAREVLLPLARSYGWPVVDAWPASLAALEGRGLAADWDSWRQVFLVRAHDHPSPAAHRLFADLLWEELARLGVVQSPPAPG